MKLIKWIKQKQYENEHKHDGYRCCHLDFWEDPITWVMIAFIFTLVIALI